MGSLNKSTWVALGILFLTQSGLAKQLEERVGFGFTYHDFNGTAALSMRYHPTNALGINFIAGLNTDPSNNNLILGAKVFRNLHIEENANVYLGLGGYALSEKDPQGVSSTGAEFDGYIGSEFFLSGLPNLGFIFEAGLALRALKQVSFKTVGGGFASAGIHFYF